MSSSTSEKTCLDAHGISWMESTRDTLIRKSSLLALAHLAAKPLGFLVVTSMAARWGQGGQKDDYDLAFTAMTLFMLVVAGFNYYIVPALTRYLAHQRKSPDDASPDNDDAQRLTRFSLVAFALMLSALTLIVFFFSETFLTAAISLFNKDQPADSARAAFILRCLAPCILTMGLMTLVGTVLNCYGIFYRVALGQVAYNTCVLIGIFGFSRYFAADHSIAGVAVGNVIGGAVAVLLFVPPLIKQGVFSRASLSLPDGALREAYYFFWPILIITLCVQINGFAERFLSVSLPEGAVATFGYAYYLILLPVQTADASFKRVFFPSVSREAVLSDKQAGDIIFFSVKTLLFLFLPLALYLVVFAPEVITLAFQRGNFTASDTARAYPVFRLLACGMPAIVLNNLVLSQIFFSIRRPWWRAGVVIVGVAVQVTLGFLLREYKGVQGIAMALAIARTLNVLTGLMALAWLMRGLPFKRLGSVVFRIFVASAAMAGACYGVRLLLSGIVDGGSTFGAFLLLIAGVLVATIVYLLLVVLFRLKTTTEILDTVALVTRRRTL